jgi:hypothetical protein
MSQHNILSIKIGIGDGQNVQHKSRLNVQGSHCHRHKMLQWTFWLGQNVTVDVVNLDVSSRHRIILGSPPLEYSKNYGQNPRRHVVFINFNQLDGKDPRLLVTHSPELVSGNVWPIAVAGEDPCRRFGQNFVRTSCCLGFCPHCLL